LKKKDQKKHRKVKTKAREDVQTGKSRGAGQWELPPIERNGYQRNRKKRVCVKKNVKGLKRQKKVGA